MSLCGATIVSGSANGKLRRLADYKMRWFAPREFAALLISDRNFDVVALFAIHLQ